MTWSVDRPAAGTPEYTAAQDLIKRIAQSTDLAERSQMAEGLPKSWREISAVRKWINPTAE